MKLLIVVDMQNDFIDGSLGTPEAQSIVPNVVSKIQHWNGDIIQTMDIHDDTYLLTNEGLHLPIRHCLEGSDGCATHSAVSKAIREARRGWKIYQKDTFGCEQLARDLQTAGYDYIELVGVCTDICVIANAILLKTFLPEVTIAVNTDCCAGTTPENHDAAMHVMRSCQIDIV